MKVIVDWDLCESNAVCVQMCPELFSISDDDKLIIATDAPDESLRSKIEDAVVSCPKQAMSLED